MLYGSGDCGSRAATLRHHGAAARAGAAHDLPRSKAGQYSGAARRRIRAGGLRCGEKAQKERRNGHHAARDGRVCGARAVRRLGTVRREDRHLRHRSGPASYDHRTPAAGDRVEAAARDSGFKRGKPAIRRDGQNIASLLHDRAIYAIFLLQGIGKSAEGGARKLRERRDSEKKALGNCWV